eukprot:6149981-Pyramimonas_sp.AAC.1
MSSASPARSSDSAARAPRAQARARRGLTTAQTFEERRLCSGAWPSSTALPRPQWRSDCV